MVYISSRRWFYTPEIQKEKIKRWLVIIYHQSHLLISALVLWHFFALLFINSLTILLWCLGALLSVSSLTALLGNLLAMLVINCLAAFLWDLK